MTLEICQCALPNEPTSRIYASVYAARRGWSFAKTGSMQEVHTAQHESDLRLPQYKKKNDKPVEHTGQEASGSLKAALSSSNERTAIQAMVGCVLREGAEQRPDP